MGRVRNISVTSSTQFRNKKIMKVFINLLIISGSLAGPTGVPERDLMCPTECADLEQFGSILERGSRPHFPDHVHDDCDLRSDADCDCAICDGATILPMRSFDLTTLPFDESTIRPIDHSTNRRLRCFCSREEMREFRRTRRIVKVVGCARRSARYRPSSCGSAACKEIHTRWRIFGWETGDQPNGKFR